MASASNATHFPPLRHLSAQNGTRAEGIATVHWQAMIKDMQNTGHNVDYWQKMINVTSTCTRYDSINYP
jgi:hypothetical protein